MPLNSPGCAVGKLDIRAMTLDSHELYFTAAQEDRSAPRTQISIPAQLRPSGGRGFHTVVQDLSLSGFCATSITRLHPGMVCWLTLPGLGSLQGKAVWWENNLAGCSFDQLLSPFVHDNLLLRFSNK